MAQHHKLRVSPFPPLPTFAAFVRRSRPRRRFQDHTGERFDGVGDLFVNQPIPFIHLLVPAPPPF